MSKMIIGCGYLGLRIARLWRDAGHHVHTCTRTCQKAETLAAEGFHPTLADILQPESLRQLPDCETVLMAVAHDASSGVSRHDTYVRGLSNLLKALSPNTRRFLYISSTGVYGDFGGDWVDESSPCVPIREGGQACLEAEQTLAAHPIGDRAIVFRMAGLYGPDRVPRLCEIAAAEPIQAATDGYLNLIHIDDAAQIVVTAEQQIEPPQTYVVSDGTPVLRIEYLKEIAKQLGASEPTFAQPPTDAPDVVRSIGNKRIRNLRMLRDLDVTLQYADYRTGLKEILARPN